MPAGAALALSGLWGMSVHHYGGAVERTIASIQAGQTVDPPSREIARDVLRKSSDGSLVALAGIVSADEAARIGVRTPDGRIWLNRAVSDLKRGLASAPADGISWLRLAGADYVLNGPSQSVVDAMRMTSYSLRNNFDAAPLLLTLSAAMWTQLEPGMQTAARDAVRRHWGSKRYRSKLNGLALTGSGRALLVDAIGDTEELRTWIDTRLATKRAGVQSSPRSPALRPRVP